MKVLFFDYWLKGVANFERLVPEFQKHENIELKMIHVGSWKESQQIIINRHKGFVSYDINYYHTYSLYKVLKREKPNVIVMLNLYYLLDKSLVTFCKKLGIKVVYLSHGRLGDDSKQISDFLKKDLKQRLLSKIRIDTLAVLYNYMLSTFISGKPLRFVRSLYKLCQDPASMTLFSTYTTELAADKILLYYEGDKDILISKRQFPDKNIYVVGNPELDMFIQSPVKDKHLFCASMKIKPENYLLYLDDGFVQSRLMTTEVWYQLMMDLNRICVKHEMKLVVKLHPRTDIDVHRPFFEKNRILALKQVDFKNIIEHAVAVTSLVSTTISLALIAQKRIISPRWGAFGDIDINYPSDVICYSYSAEDFENQLLSTESTNISTTFISRSIGKVDGCSIKRIINHILS